MLILQYSQLPTERLHQRLFPCHITMTISVGGGESYPGHNFSISQLLDAAKRKLLDSTFDGGYVWNYTCRVSRRVNPESCRISMTMNQAEVRGKGELS